MTDIERFMTKVLPEPNSGCWLWMGGLATNGYGMFSFRLKKVTASRWAYENLGGKSIPPGLDVCHKCDVRPCVNPAHLFHGTRSENMQDSVRKGRYTPRDTAKFLPHFCNLFCNNGHAMFGPTSSTVVYKGKRYCVPCKSARMKIRNSRRYGQKEAPNATH